MTLVSIIMPMYNASEYIAKSILSVQAQTFSNWELIIVDDCSIDNSYHLAKKASDDDSRIIVLSNQHNIGVAETRNRGIRKANGRYIAFLDSDDLWLPLKLDKQIKFMQERMFPICYSSYYTINSNSRRTGFRKIPSQTSYKILLNSNHIGMLTAVYDTQFFSKQYFLNIHHEDYEMWLRLFKKIPDKIFGIKEPLAEYRVHAGSKSSNKLKALVWRWRIYHNVERLGFIKSLLCMTRSLLSIMSRTFMSKFRRCSA